MLPLCPTNIMLPQLHTSWFNSHFQLGPWFWTVSASLTSPRPKRYQPGSFVDLEVGTLAEVTEYLHNPKLDLQRMQSLYCILRSNMPGASHLLSKATIAARSTSSDFLGMRICHEYSLALAVLLRLASCMNYLIRHLESEAELFMDARGFVDKIILLAEQCASYRPYGASFLPDYLKMMLASTPDSYRASEIEAILVDYEKDFEGACFVEEAFQIRKWLRSQAQAREG